MAVRESCKHYILQSVSMGDKLERCKLNVNEPIPFACPDDCLFFEARTGVSRIGWQMPNPHNRRRPNSDDR